MPASSPRHLARALSALTLLLFAAPARAEVRKSTTTSSANAQYAVQFLQTVPDRGARPQVPAPDAGASPSAADAGLATEGPGPDAGTDAASAVSPPCRLEVRRESGVAWTLDRCLGEASDLYFVSDDGERVWVLHTLPKTPRGRNAWLGVVVAKLYGRDGQLKAQRKVAQLMPAQTRDDVRRLGHHFKWLEGVLGERGVPPRVNDQGELEFWVQGAQKQTLSFR